MNYTLNRPLLDGTSPARLKEISAVAQQIKDYDSWHTVWLGLAKRAEAEKRWQDAASYYHGAEFYLPAVDVRNGLYDDFARTWALGIEGVAGYERIAVPYPGGHLPGFRLQAKGRERGTFIFNGGYDSFVEEFYAFLLPLNPEDPADAPPGAPKGRHLEGTRLVVASVRGGREEVATSCFMPGLQIRRAQVLPGKK